MACAGVDEGVAVGQDVDGQAVQGIGAGGRGPAGASGRCGRAAAAHAGLKEGVVGAVDVAVAVEVLGDTGGIDGVGRAAPAGGQGAQVGLVHVMIAVEVPVDAGKSAQRREVDRIDPRTAGVGDGGHGVIAVQEVVLEAVNRG